MVRSFHQTLSGISHSLFDSTSVITTTIWPKGAHDSKNPISGCNRPAEHFRRWTDFTNHEELIVCEEL